MTSYTIESYLTDYVYPEQGAAEGEPLPADHQDTIDVITIGVNSCPWGDQSVGVNDAGEKLYDVDFLDVASAIGLAAKFTNTGESDLAERTLQLAFIHFISYVDAHPELAAA